MLTTFRDSWFESAAIGFESDGGVRGWIVVKPLPTRGRSPPEAAPGPPRWSDRSLRLVLAPSG
jgi:hypothetical protein